MMIRCYTLDWPTAHPATAVCVSRVTEAVGCLASAHRAVPTPRYQLEVVLAAQPFASPSIEPTHQGGKSATTHCELSPAALTWSSGWSHCLAQLVLHLTGQHGVVFACCDYVRWCPLAGD